MIQKSDYLLNNLKDGSLEICIQNEEIGEICLGFLVQDDLTPKSFEDIFSDFNVQTFIKEVEEKAEEYVYILIRTDDKGIKYKYTIETEEIEKICEIEPFKMDDSRLVKLLVQKEITFKKFHKIRLFAIACLIVIILIMQNMGITLVIPYILLGLTIWTTIYKWLHHIVHEKF